jgi:hypothetical protein
MENNKEEEINFLKKQNEITDYRNKSNMNMIFLFQIIFIFLLIIVILLYLQKIGILTSTYLYGSITLFGFVVFLIFYNRIFITSKYRDARNFDRINFGDNTYVTSSYNKLPPSDGTSGSFNKIVSSSSGTCRTQTVCT